MHRVAVPAINHIGVDIAQVVEVSHESAQRIGINGEMTCSGVLHQVSFCPRLVSRHDLINLCYVLTEVEVEGSPVPSRIQFDGLPLVAVSSEVNGFAVSTTVYRAVGEDDIAVCREVIDLIGRSLPQAELDRLAVHLFFAEDGDEDVGLVGDIVEVHIRHTDALIVAERDDFVIRVGIEDISDLDLSAERHVIREFACLGFFVRAFGRHLNLDEERFGQSLIVCQIDHMVMQTGFENFLDGESNRLLILCFECTLCGRDGEPSRQTMLLRLA